jgi:MbtH protein
MAQDQRTSSDARRARPAQFTATHRQGIFPAGDGMANPFEGESGEFFVLANDEGQYSIWPTFRAIPPGWTAVGQAAGRQACLNWIDAHWTDMRPLSVVKTAALSKH